MKERIALIEAATKLWQGLEGQKEWNQNHPEILKIVNGAITRLQWEIILAAQPPSES